MAAASGRYSRLVIDHFERPRASGALAAAPDVIESRAGERERGAAYRLSARVASDRIVEARAAVYGCPHCVAAASWLAERLPGMTRERLRAWRWREAADALDIPAEKRGRLIVLEDAVQALAAAWDNAERAPRA